MRLGVLQRPATTIAAGGEEMIFSRLGVRDFSHWQGFCMADRHGM